SAFAGQTIQIRFHFDTVDATSNQFLGWQLDDIQVAAGITDPAFSGVTVFVDVNGNNTFDGGDLSAATDASGNYTITGVGPGTFPILQVTPAGFVQTTATPSIAGSSGSNVEGVDFGDFDAVSFSGRKANDLNGDGSITADPGQGGVTIQLIKDAND